MMILSDASIREAVESGRIGVEPEPEDMQYQPASLDLRLGQEQYHVDDDEWQETSKHCFLPGERYLCHTEEKITLPNDIAAQLAGRSSVGRRGVIVHKTAGWVDPSFSGTVTLEIMNLGRDEIVFTSGERIAQLVFFQLDSSSSGYSGKYQGQERPTKARTDHGND